VNERRRHRSQAEEGNAANQGGPPPVAVAEVAGERLPDAIPARPST
jgi:hypothetical protein